MHVDESVRTHLLHAQSPHYYIDKISVKQQKTNSLMIKSDNLQSRQLDDSPISSSDFNAFVVSSIGS